MGAADAAAEGRGGAMKTSGDHRVEQAGGTLDLCFDLATMARERAG